MAVVWRMVVRHLELQPLWQGRALPLVQAPGAPNRQWWREAPSEQPEE